MCCTSRRLCGISIDATGGAIDARHARDRMAESWAVLHRWRFEANPTHLVQQFNVRTRDNDTLCQREPVSAMMTMMKKMMKKMMMKKMMMKTMKRMMMKKKMMIMFFNHATLSVREG